MKTVLKHFVIDAVSLYLISLGVKGLVFTGGLATILLAGAVLAITTMLVKPVINLLLLPINLITFGLFKWIGQAVSLYIVTLAVPGFKVLDFAFNGISAYWFVIPRLSLSGTLAFIAFSFLISVTSSFIYCIFK